MILTDGFREFYVLLVVVIKNVRHGTHQYKENELAL